MPRLGAGRRFPVSSLPAGKLPGRHRCDWERLSVSEESEVRCTQRRDRNQVVIALWRGVPRFTMRTAAGFRLLDAEASVEPALSSLQQLGSSPLPSMTRLAGRPGWVLPARSSLGDRRCTRLVRSPLSRRFAACGAQRGGRVQELAWRLPLRRGKRLEATMRTPAHCARHPTACEKVVEVRQKLPRSCGSRSRCCGSRSRCSGSLSRCCGSRSRCRGSRSQCRGSRSRCCGSLSRCRLVLRLYRK